VHEEVEHRVDPELVEPLGLLLPHTLQARDLDLGQLDEALPHEPNRRVDP
jgi:hypothetical protein